jgi:PEP-CTERM motif
MKQRITLSIVLLAGSSLLAAAIAHANSTFTATLTQVGPNVVATGSGTIDLTGLSSFGSTTFPPELYPAHGILGIGPFNTVDTYSGLSGPFSFGTGFGGFPSTTSGDSVFLEDFALDIEVPHGYVSGTSLSGSATYSGTLASLNVTPGTYIWTWDSGENSYVLNIPPAPAVPEPGTFSLLALALAGLAVLRGRRRSRASLIQAG